jgi:hypothetical protein
VVEEVEALEHHRDVGMARRSPASAHRPVWPTMEDFAEYNAMPRYVVSGSLTGHDSRWPATIVRTLDDVDLVEHDTYSNGIQMKVYDVIHG